jgi:hypothetical protein
MMTDPLTRPEYLAVIASWSIPAREAFGHRFNALALPSLANLVEAEPGGRTAAEPGDGGPRGPIRPGGPS